MGALGGGAYLFLYSGGDGEVKPYTIAFPDKLLDGQYAKRTTPLADETAKAADAQAKSAGISHGTAVAALYGDDKQGITVSGIYGTIADPRKAVDDYASHLDDQQKIYAEKVSKNPAGVKVTTVTPLTEFHPDGFDGAVIKCKATAFTSTVASNTAKFDVTTCVWGDSSAVGIVQNTVSKNDAPVGIGNSDISPDVMSTQDLSEATVKVRNEVRKAK
ncbi:hypothetical protein [Streptomyces orinoci]|uniref:Secreted protein n=1 Tax=Streptomyces orinoci TaxID=67339 RepID=A0ABV3JZN5_STRON|nr:hypothetical protein [Streptomyces orinoci]